MWVRKNTNGELYDYTTNALASSMLNAGVAYSMPIRCWCARSISFLLHAASGTATIAVWVSHLDNPSSSTPADWVVMSATQGLHTQTAATVMTAGGGQFINGSAPNSANGLITAKWARLVVTATSAVTSPLVDAAAIFDGDDCPKVKVGRGYVAKGVDGTLYVDGSNL
jgi:hypothetical protein